MISDLRLENWLEAGAYCEKRALMRNYKCTLLALTYTTKFWYGSEISHLATVLSVRQTWLELKTCNDYSPEVVH